MNDRTQKIVASSPVNRTAALVVSRGVSWNSKLPLENPYDSETPIPTSFMPRGLKDLRGIVFGRLTVIGYFGRKKKGKGTQARHRWVVKCFCGTYTVRRQTTLIKLRTRNDNDCCDRCKHLDRIRKR
jgi:hypothetical protein